MRRKVITLDYQTRKRIVELLAVRKFLLQNKRARLGRATTILYGFCVCSGFLFGTGLIREGGWFDLAPALIILFAGCWVVAQWLEELKTSNAVKIRIK